MRSVTTPASFFGGRGTARDDDDSDFDDGLTLPFVPETRGADSSTVDDDLRSALLIYSEDASRRMGVGCFVRAMDADI